MTILYRAIWHEDGSGAPKRALEVFREWVADKTRGALVLDDPVGNQQEQHANGFRCRVEQAEEVDPIATVSYATRASFTEERPNGAKWTTRLRAWSGSQCHKESGSASWLWVDVEAVTYDTFRGITIAAPRFVRTLIAEGERPGRGPVALTTSPMPFRGILGAEALASVLENYERDLPFVVFSSPRSSVETDSRLLTQRALVQRAMERTAQQVAGIAQVGIVDAAAATHLRSIVGDSLYVDHGAFRIYLPGVDPALDQGWRHRFVRLPEYSDDALSAVRIITRKIAPSSTTRRAPESWDDAARLIESARTRTVEEDRELLEIYAAELDSQQHEIAELKDQLNELLDEHANLQSEHTALRTRLRTAEDNLTALARSGGQAKQVATPSVSQISLPTEVYSPSHAVGYARNLLSDYLDIPEGAVVDVADLDTMPQRKSWGQTSWEGFLALWAFARDHAQGIETKSFWVWCQHSGNPFVWRATEKKLAMVESQSVMNQRKLLDKRYFPVDPRVDPSGRTLMTAHLKIAEGGGNLAPRIYFFYSPVTGKCHVGYFGPHKNVPNTVS